MDARGTWEGTVWELGCQNSFVSGRSGFQPSTEDKLRICTQLYLSLRQDILCSGDSEKGCSPSFTLHYFSGFGCKVRHPATVFQHLSCAAFSPRARTAWSIPCPHKAGTEAPPVLYLYIDFIHQSTRKPPLPFPLQLNLCRINSFWVRSSTVCQCSSVVDGALSPK